MRRFSGQSYASFDASANSNVLSSLNATPGSLSSYSMQQHDTETSISIDSPYSTGFAREDSFGLAHSTFPDRFTAEVNTAYSRRMFFGNKRILVVHFLHNPRGSVPPMEQLLIQARLAIPAICNFMFFGAAKCAVIYLGKQRKGPHKYGIPGGGSDFKKKVISLMLHEIWPPLRTDVPDDSAVAHLGLTQISGSNMQALVYLKACTDDTAYIKVVIHYTGKLYFDITDAKEERMRWDQRKLHIRSLSSLNKVTESYEAYEAAFREACVFAPLAEHDLSTMKAAMMMSGQLSPHGTTCTVNSATSFSFPEGDGNGTASSYPSMHSAYPYRSPTSSSCVIPVPIVKLESAWEGGGENPSRMLNPVSNLTEPSNNQVFVENTIQSIPSSTTTTSNTNSPYTHFQVLTQLESATLDYKSYFPFVTSEILEKGTKFMCGFLNAYGHGKLVIGVNEFTIDKVVYSTVIGIAVSNKELNVIAEGLGAQLALCVPPIPASLCQLTLFPLAIDWRPQLTSIKNSDQKNGEAKLLLPILVIYCLSYQHHWEEWLRAQINHALRVLANYGFTVVDIDDPVPSEINEKYKDAELVALYAIIPIPEKSELKQTEKEMFLSMLNTTDDSSAPSDCHEKFPNLPVTEKQGKEGHHHHHHHHSSKVTNPSKSPPLKSTPPMHHAKLGDMGSRTLLDIALDALDDQLDKFHMKGLHEIELVDAADIIISTRYVIELSVEKRRSKFHVEGYGGKYFDGWPSIPLWNTTTHSATCVDRNYNLFSYNNKRRMSNVIFGVPHSWFCDSNVVNGVIEFLVDPLLPQYQHILFRGINSTFNEAVEQYCGKDLLTLLEPRCRSQDVSSFLVDEASVRNLQKAFRVSKIPCLPLLLGWTFQHIGGLPSPYPYVRVPISLTNIRSSAQYVPIYYKQTKFGGLQIAIVVDTKTGLLKAVNHDYLKAHEMLQQSNNKSSSVGGMILDNDQLYEHICGVIFEKLTTVDQQAKIAPFQFQTSSPYYRPLGGEQQQRNLLGSSPICNSDSKHADPTTTTTSGPREVSSPPFHQGPWGLKNLLIWLLAISHDHRIIPYGPTGSSYAYQCDPTMEVCTWHLAESSPDMQISPSLSQPPVVVTTPRFNLNEWSFVSPATLTNSTFPDVFDCVLHHAEMSWIQWS